MQSDNEAPVKVVERRAQSHREINALVETRTDTLSLLGELASKQPFTPEHSTQQLLQNFCESLIDQTATAHFQLYRHIDENKERRVAAREIAEQVYPRISETTQSFLAFNDKYDALTHTEPLDHLNDDLARLGEEIAMRIDVEDQLVEAMLAEQTEVA